MSKKTLLLTFLKYVEFVDVLIINISDCEKFGRVEAEIEKKPDLSDFPQQKDSLDLVRKVFLSDFFFCFLKLGYFSSKKLFFLSCGGERNFPTSPYWPRLTLSQFCSFKIRRSTKIYVVGKRRSTDFKASKIAKSLVGTVGKKIEEEEKEV